MAGRELVATQRILVLDDGQSRKQGNHEQLLELGAVMPSSLTFKLKAIVDLHPAQTLEARQGLVRPSAPELCEFIFQTSKLILG